MKKKLIEKWKTLRLYCVRNSFPLDAALGIIIGFIIFVLLIFCWIS